MPVVIPNYRITGRLGEGGMGVVYRAEHTLLHRPTAIKVLQGSLSANQDVVRRFFNEARAATAIRHPGIVEIYDFGIADDGSAFIVMELLDGQSLAERLARGPMSSMRAIQIAKQIAGALSAAHDAGIVHRDLKPDNVFLVPDPEVPGGERIKLLDFGIAKLAPEPGAMNHTRTGVLMGTPTYMAPEQCRGVHVDHRADLYSLGCILYECVCGRPPFAGEGVGDVLSSHIHEPPTPPRAFARVPPALEAVILRLLAKSPDDRPATAAQVIRELDIELPNTITGAATAVSARPRTVAPRWRSNAVLFVVPVVASAAIAITLGRVSSSRGPARAAADVAIDAPVRAVAIDAPVAVAAVPVVPDAVSVDAGPAMVEVAIDSAPSGATVLADGVELGRTPLRATLPAARVTVTFTISLAGYEESQLRMPGDHAIDTTVVLKQKRRAPSRPQAPAADPDRGVNPFQ